MNSGRAPRRRSERRFRALPPVVVGVAALTLSACGGGGKSGGGGDTNFVTNTGGISSVAPADRKPANQLSGETLDGKQLDVADLKGKIVVMNVWGSWCPPCRAEAPHFAKVAKETESKGVAFVGINTRDPNKGPALAFEKDYGVPYPSLYDPAGKLIVNGFPKGSLNPQSIPSTIVLDQDGKIAARALLALDAEKLRKMIDPLIAEK
ncbi:TlpA family protein disulfide reductase [Streptomyces scopuliridis]|uniref:TlpA family protein disulfide reductase n=1 Tax=Streptomyces scopuliridis TaxID=452529 RepID=UPI002DD897DC|nr:TlpA disulfide reductase family protein [Streptomyces scopuliridis]WSB34193.1 TlpA family protein disulfide reductase [Streptomyces scopuliridis]